MPDTFTTYHGWTKPEQGKNNWHTDYYDLLDDVDTRVPKFGVAADRPSQPPDGAVYWSTDAQVIERYDAGGDVWVAFGGTYSDSDATDAVGGSTPWANADLENAGVTVAGNSVDLGGSTGVAHGDLSDAPAAAHHEVFEPADYTPEADTHDKYTDSEATTAVGGSTPWENGDLANSSVSVAGNSVSLGGSTGISHGDLSDSPSDAHHEVFEPADYTPEADTHDVYTDSEARLALSGDGTEREVWVSTDGSIPSGATADDIVLTPSNS